MNRAIFNITKYSIFLYLHCTDTQINVHYSSALLPPLCCCRRKNNTAEFQDNRRDDTLHTLALAHAYTLLLRSM